MATLKELKQKINSVKNTQKTTRAMKLVSTAKLKRAEEAIFRSREYARKIDEVMQEISAKLASVKDSIDIRAFAKIEKIKKSKALIREKIEHKKMHARDKKIFLNGKWVNAKVYEKIYANNIINGPALILQKTSTILLDEGSEAFINEYGDITIKLNSVEKKDILKEAKLSLYANRLKFIATKMGDILKKTAMSANIKEREDFFKDLPVIPEHPVPIIRKRKTKRTFFIFIIFLFIFNHLSSIILH